MHRRLIILTLLLALAACAPPELPFTLDDLPAGDAGSGSKIFLQAHDDAPPCASCHTTDGSSGGVGPDLSGFGARAGSRVKEQSAEQYTFNSITRPGLYMVQGYSNLMYNDYANKLDPQDVADLMTYVLSL